MDEQLPVVSRNHVTIQTVRRGDLVRRAKTYGATRRTDSAVEAVFTVRAELVQDMMVGQPAVVGIGNRLHQGWVDRIQPPAGSEFSVTVALRDAPVGLGGEEPVVASIQTDRINNVLVIGGIGGPILAGRVVSLFRIEIGSAYATRVAVRFGKTSAKQAEIWSGLQEGDRVIAAGIELPESVQRVRLR